MFSWLIESIIGLFVEVMIFFADIFLNALGNDLSTFLSLLPNDVINESFEIMQGLGIGIVIIVISWQLFKTFGLPIGIEAENPVQIAWKSVLSILCIIFSWQIFNLGFTVINGGYADGESTTLYPSTMARIAGLTDDSLMQDTFSLSDFSYNLEDLAVDIGFTFSSGTATVMLVAAGIMIIIILFNLIKMLLELLERYCLLGVLALTSPLGFSTMCSAATSNIFRAWVRMCVGQYIMLLLNIWSIKIFMAMASNSMNSDSFIIWMFFLLAFTKIAQKLDTYLQRLGLEVGSTGGSLLGELMAVRLVASGGPKGMSSTMGGAMTQGGFGAGLMTKGVAIGSALNLSGVPTAFARGAQGVINNAKVNGTSGNKIQMMANAMMAGASGGVSQFSTNVLKNNTFAKGYSAVKYQSIKSQFDSFGAEGSSKVIGKAVDINGEGALGKANAYNVASKMMNDTNRIYNGDDCVSAGRAIFGDSIGSYNLSSDKGATVENARMGNGAFKFDNPSTGESVTVMKSNQVPQQLKNNASSMHQHGDYSVITQPMHSVNDSGGTTPSPKSESHDAGRNSNPSSGQPTSANIAHSNNKLDSFTQGKEQVHSQPQNMPQHGSNPLNRGH